MTVARAAARTGGWLVALVAAVVVLHTMGGQLSPPPVLEPQAVGPWLQEREPLEAAFSVLRLVALALAWYLLVIVTLGAAGRLLRLRHVVSAANVITVPALRQVVHGALGLSITTNSLAALSRPVSAADASAESSSPPVMRRLPDPVPPVPSAPAGTERALAEPTPAGPEPVPEWTVKQGEHFWAVAEAVLTEAWGRHPSDAQVVPFWRTLVDANRRRLRNPADPDQIFPGQKLAVPAVPPAPPPPPVPPARA